MIIDANEQMLVARAGSEIMALHWFSDPLRQDLPFREFGGHFRCDSPHIARHVMHHVCEDLLLGQMHTINTVP